MKLIISMLLCWSAFAQLPYPTIPDSDGATFRGKMNGNFSWLYNNKAATSHVHAATDVTSGTLDPARIPSLNYQAPITGAPGAWPSTFTPATHVHAASDVTSGVFDVLRIPALNYQAVISGAPGSWPSFGGAALLNVGIIANTVAAGDDTRMTNARTPTTHASTHASGGTDPVSPAAIGAVPVTRLVAGKALSSDVVIACADLSNAGTGCSGTLPVASSTNPVTDGTASPGTGTTYARNDHVHPTDTSRAAASAVSNVTNDAQTKASIMPNTAPAAGQIAVGNAGGTAYAPVTISGDCTAASTGAVTCTKLNNVNTATAATASTIAVRNPSGEIIAANTVPTGRTATYTLASGSTTMTTGALAANTCATATTVSATGVLTTDVIAFSPNADVSAAVGYGAGSTDGLKLYPYPTADNVNFKICNGTGSSITVPAMTINWRVAR